MQPMPISRCCDHIGQRLQSLPALVQAFEKIAAGSIDQQYIRRRSLRYKIEQATICGDAKLKERVVPPDLIFQRSESPALDQVDGGRQWRQRVQSEVQIFRAVVERAGMDHVARRNVELQAQQIIAGPF